MLCLSTKLSSTNKHSSFRLKMRGGRGKKKMVFDTSSPHGRGLKAMELARKMTRAMESRQNRTRESSDICSKTGGGSNDKFNIQSCSDKQDDEECVKVEGGTYKLVVDSDTFLYDCVVCGTSTLIGNAHVEIHPHLIQPVVVTCRKCCQNRTKS